MDLPRGLVAIASQLVPLERRSDWRREWAAELAEARRTGRSRLRLAAGALADAWATRRVETEAMGGASMSGWPIAIEVRRAVRSLRHSPAFTTASVLTLALGVAATTTMLTLVDSILLRPLDIPDADRVVRIHHTFGDREGGDPVAQFALPFFQENERTFELIGAHWGPSDLTLAGSDAPERVRGVRATPELLTLLGATAVVGRLFDAADAAEEAGGVLLGHRLWVRSYGSDPGVVGRTIEVDGRSRPVLGVLREGLELPGHDIDLWLPYVVPAGIRADDSFRLYPLARLDPGVDPAAAQEDLARMTARFPEAADFYRVLLDEYGLSTELRPIRDEIIGDIERPLWIVLGAVLVVLAVAAGNAATLFLARTEDRRQEVAVRRALGAGRRGVVAHFFTESALIALVAGALGLLVAALAVRAIPLLAPPDLPRLDELALGWRMVGATALISVVLAGVLSLYPVVRFGGDDPGPLGSRVTGETRTQGAVGSGMVVAQVALAVVLLTGSALLLRTFVALRSVDPGFDPAGVLVADFALSPPAYPTTPEILNVHDRLLRRLESVPGVEAVALGPSPVGLRGCNGLYIEGRILPADAAPPCVLVLFASPEYWSLLDLELVEGDADAEPATVDAVPSAWVSATTANRLWPNGDAVGAGVHPSPRMGPPWYPVRGVVESARNGGPDQPPGEAVYLPFAAMEELGWLQHTFTLLLRTEPGRELDFVPLVRSALGEIAPSTPLSRVHTLAEAHRSTMQRSTLTLTLLATAAAITLLLGLVGLYGVVAHRVGAIRAEIGLRMALGAAGSQVRSMVLGRALRLVALGAMLGIGLALLTTRVLSTLLFGVEPADPTSMGGALAVLFATAFAACWIPASRAGRTDPATVLKG